MDPRELIARRVARELRDNTLVNLGIGLPTMVAQFVPPGLRGKRQRSPAVDDWWMRRRRLMRCFW